MRAAHLWRVWRLLDHRLSYPVGKLCRRFTKLTGPIHYIVIWYPQQMVQMAFCDLSHTFHKQVANVSHHVFVILPWGILTLPLSYSIWLSFPVNSKWKLRLPYLSIALTISCESQEPYCPSISLCYNILTTTSATRYELYEKAYHWHRRGSVKITWGLTNDFWPDSEKHTLIITPAVWDWQVLWVVLKVGYHT